MVSAPYPPQLRVGNGSNHLGRGILIAIYPIQGFFRRIKNILRRVVAAIYEIMLILSPYYFAGMLE